MNLAQKRAIKTMLKQALFFLSYVIGVCTYVVCIIATGIYFSKIPGIGSTTCDRDIAGMVSSVALFVVVPCLIMAVYCWYKDTVKEERYKIQWGISQI